MTMRFGFLLAVTLAAACRGNGKVAGSASGPGSEAPVVAPKSGTGPTSDALPPAPPAESARLVPVPPEIARGVAFQQVSRGLARPVLLVAAPGDTRKRLFVLEQHAGRVRILENGKLLARPFLEITGLSKGNEQGLLGMAFHPQFATNGKLYVNYTGADDDTRIVEYRVSAKNPDEVDPASRRELLKIEQPYSNHNGGHLVFGPDGKLWTGMGDGGSAGDPERKGQNPKALLGKMLRIDVDAATPTPERVHVGVRNPWRFAFDSKTGDLMIADVGQNLWEYIFVVSGTDGGQKNFGWNVVEGNHCYAAASCDRTGFTAPVVDYPHEEGCSITGGVVYRGKALPALDGQYFYADFCTGLLRSFRWRDGAVRDHWDWKQALDPDGALSQVSSFGVDHDGEVYLVTLTGGVFKLIPTS
ncbi:MAG: PQQ-dependent sugar dehydrogenase [Kofleriaceae bacterium]|nr:PQQ-dependent sugar dehydrogenase [Kofleriaceae bacterium]